MGDRWLPWSAASLASGAVLVVLGIFALPASLDIASLLESAQNEDAMWLVAAVAFALASMGLTLGLPTIYSLLPVHRAALGMVGLWIWSMGMIGTAGLASLLVGFRALVHTMHFSHAETEQLSSDPAMLAFFAIVMGSFYVGELIVALVLLSGRTVSRWVPLLLMGHLLLSGITVQMPESTRPVQSVVLAAALVAMAVKASENWAQERELQRR